MLVRICCVCLLLVGAFSSQGQITFSPLGGPSGGQILSIKGNSTGTLFTLASDGVYKSVDGATSWTQLSTYPSNATPLDLYIDNSDKIYVLNKNGVANSTDAGATWNQINAVSGFQFPRKLLKNESTGTLFIIGYTGSVYGLYKSTDQGANWIASYSSNQVNDFTIKGSSIYIAPNGGTDKISKNTNDGNPLNWTGVNTNLPGATAVSIDVNKTSGNIYAIFYGPGVYFTANDGTSWSAATAPPVTLNYGNSSGGWQIFPFTGSNQWLVAYAEDKNNYANGVVRLYLNSAANGTWTELTSLNSLSPINTVYATGTNILVGYYSAGLLKSGNSGTNWNTGDKGINISQNTGLIVPANYSLLSANGSNWVSYSFDNNFNPTFPTWTRSLTGQTATPGTITSFVKLSSGNVLAVGSRTYETTSASNYQTFTAKGTTPGTVTLSKAYRHADNKLYAIGSTTCCPVVNNAYLSTDQGVNWNILAIAGASWPANREIINLSTTTNGDLFIGLVDNGSTPKFFKVPNASLTPTQITIPSVTSYYSIATIGSKVYALGNGSGDKLAISTDGGATWTLKPAPVYTNLYAVSDGVLFGVSGSDVYLSNDEGGTWQKVYSMTGSQNLTGVALDASYRAIFSISRGAFQISNGPVVRPAVPQNFRSAGTGSSKVFLQWDYASVPIPDDFVIERRLSSDGTFTVLNNVNYSSSLIFEDQSVVPGTDYVYRLKAENTAGFVYTPELNITTPAACASTIPDNRSWTGTVAGFSAITTINIKKTSGDFYSITDLAANSLNGAPYNMPSPVSGSFFQNCTAPFIENNSLYPNGNGSWNGTNTLVLNWQVFSPTPITKVITLVLNATDPTPDVPTTVLGYASSNTTSTISWTAGNFNNKFYIERATNSGFTTGLTSVGTVTYPTTSIIDNGPLTPGTTYFYRVKSENINLVQSAFSSTLTLAFVKPNFVLGNTVVNATKANALAASWADFDGDGDEDLLMPEYGGTLLTEKQPLFFKNNGTGDFQLTPAGDVGAYIGSTLGDYDNDGKIDAFLFGYGGATVSVPKKNTLLKNGGNFSFSSVASPNITTPSSFSLGTNWVDVNNDGKLDLFTGYWAGAKLYMGDGTGSFVEKTGDPLVTDVYETTAALWCDYDNDGDQDVYIINDNGASRLYDNNGSGAFTYVTPSAFDADAAVSRFSAAWGDYDNDGDQDLYVTADNSSTPGSNLLYKNNGNKTFTKQAVVANSPTESKSTESTGAVWVDIDNDADLDLLVANSGAVGAIYINSGTGTFTKAGAEFLTGSSNFGFVVATALADYDNNGFQDIVVGDFTNKNGVAAPFIKLLKNNNATGNWLKVKLVGKASNISAIGAKVTLTANAKTQIRDVQSTTGVTSQNSQVIHFGLGAATSITSLVIKWPSGFSQTVPVSAINQMLTITEDSAGPVIASRTPTVSATNVSTTSTISFTLDEAATSVATKKITITGVGDPSAFASIDVTTALKTGNTYSFTLPSKLTLNKQYGVTLDAGAFTDIYGNASLAVSSGWTFTTTNGPAVSSLTPAHNSTGIAAATSLAITFGVPFTAVASKNVLLYNKSNLATPVATLAATTGVVSGNTVTFALATKLNRQTVYVVSIDAGAFIDVSSNDFAGLSTTAWEFTTSAGPSVSSLTPAHNATSIAATTSLAVTFDGPVTAVASKNILLYDKSNLTTPVATLAATTGVISGNTATFTLATKLNRQTIYVVSIDAGAFIDAVSNDFAGLATTAWEFTTDPGPVVSTFLPANSATNVAVNAPIELTFNKTVTAVASKNVKVMDGATVVVNVAVSTTGTITGAKYSLPSPTGGWPFLKSLSVLVDAGAFVDANQNDFVGITSGQYSFTTVEAADVTPPTFPSFTPPATLNKGFGTSTPSVEIVDNKAVTSAKIFVRAISGTTFTEASGTFNSANNKWDFVLSEALSDAIGVQYYFEAKDAANNTGRSPSGTGYHQTYLKYTTDLQIPDAVVGVGGRKTDWKVIAIPFDLPNGGIATVFDELATKINQVDYRIITYHDDKAWAEYPSSELSVFTRGTGYFINLKSQIPLTIGANLTPPVNTRDNLFKISLKSGWNMIGNPYLTPISWADVATLNSLTGKAAKLLQYNNGNYAENNALPAYAGGFVFLDAAKEISIPFLGQTAQGGRIEEEFSSGDWILPMTISSGEVNNTFAGVGMNSKASASYDRFDDVNPPRFFDFVEMNFDHPEHFAKKFSRDVVPTQQEFTWEFVVNSNLTREAQLNWNKIEWSDAEKELYLLEEETQTLINMRETTSFVFNPGAASRFKIFFGTNLKTKIMPSRILLGQAYPNPTSGTTTIAFSLPDQNTTYQVGLEVYDLMGRKITTLLSKDNVKPGFYNVDWDSSSSNLTNGIYTYRLSVNSNRGIDVLSGKIMISR